MISTRFLVAALLLAAALVPAAVLLAMPQGPEKARKLVHRGCYWGRLADQTLCRSAGDEAIFRGEPIEVVIGAACRELPGPDAQWYCLEHITDHWGPSVVDGWRIECHRQHARVADMRRCLLARVAAAEN